MLLLLTASNFVVVSRFQEPLGEKDVDAAKDDVTVSNFSVPDVEETIVQVGNFFHILLVINYSVTLFLFSKV